MNIKDATRRLDRFGLDVTFQIQPMERTFVMIVEANGEVVYACDARSGEIEAGIVRVLISTHSKGIRDAQIHGHDSGRDFPHWITVQLPYPRPEHRTREHAGSRSLYQKRI